MEERESDRERGIERRERQSQKEEERERKKKKYGEAKGRETDR